jgi:hypothetical protein
VSTARTGRRATARPERAPHKKSLKNTRTGVITIRDDDDDDVEDDDDDDDG